MIFDETARLAGPLYPSWSKDSSDEIKKGWIVQADTVAQLAKKAKIPAAALEGQITTYNQYCANGVDPVFGRDLKYLKPLKTGPYYAIELSPSFTNTQGGPKRDEKAEVLDVDGNAIPHLYSAGELGSVYADIYNGGGNLSECIFFGRIAGKNAAAVKNDVQTTSVMQGQAPAVTSSPNTIVVSNEKGVLIGEGTGMGGKLVVKVRMNGNTISSVEVVSNHETTGISQKALVEIPKAIVKNQSTKVDAVTGASMTSNAIMSAVEDALSKK
jgi:uncharacterized protein with FMN-binding domain